MPINTRYTSGPYKTTSSLLKSAKSAQNKIQQIQDTEARFLWDTNQISNEQYLKYTQDRLSQYDKNNTSQIQDYISWARTERSVRKEIAADYRAQKMFEMALTPEKDFEAKSLMYQELYRQAAEYNDTDAMLQIETAYMNNMAAAARAGEASAKKAANEQYNLAKNDIDLERINIANDTTLTPIEKAASIADVDAREAKLNLLKLANTTDAVDAGNIIEKITRLQGKIAKNAQMFDATMTDQNGNAIDINNVQPGQIVAGFTPKFSRDVLGKEKPILNKNFAEYWDGQQWKIMDKSTGSGLAVTYDESGSPVFTKTEGKLNPNDFTVMKDEGGGEYLAKIQSQPTEATIYTGAGEKVTPSGEKPKEQYFVIDKNRNRYNYNPNTQTFSAPNVSEEMAPINAKFGAAADLLEKAKTASREDYQTVAGEFGTARGQLEAGTNKLLETARANQAVINAKLAAENKRIAEAQAAAGQAAMVSAVNPFTYQYEQPKSYPAPYKLPQPTYAEKQAAANILNPSWVGGYSGTVPKSAQKQTQAPKQTPMIWAVPEKIGKTVAGGIANFFRKIF